MNRRPSQEQIIEKIQRMAADVPVWMFEGEHGGQADPAPPPQSKVIASPERPIPVKT